MNPDKRHFITRRSNYIPELNMQGYHHFLNTPFRFDWIEYKDIKLLRWVFM